MTTTLKPVNILALVLLAVALVGAVCFVMYGVRTGLSAWFMLGVVGAIFNVLLLGYSLLGPLYSDLDLRYALLSIFLETWFFVGGAFAVSVGRFKIAAISALAGVMLHALVTGRRLRRLSRRSL